MIARLVIFDDRTVSVDYCRDNGFLQGMGIDIGDLTVIGDEAETGNYTTGAGGDYEIVCIEATGANEEGGRTGMETCLAQNPDINVVYTINEPTAFGAAAALEAAGKTIGEDVLVVSVDGGLAGVEAVQAGGIQATSQQYPLRMASLGVEAITEIATGGAAPDNTSDDGTFFDTGVALCHRRSDGHGHRCRSRRVAVLHRQRVGLTQAASVSTPAEESNHQGSGRLGRCPGC